MCRLLVLLVSSAAACAGPDMTFRQTNDPPSSPYAVSASVEALRRDYYAVTITVRNDSTQALALDATMFELTAPPATFLQLRRLSFGRRAVRMPPSIAPARAGNGQIFFQMVEGDADPTSATLHVHLPTGDHQIVFDLD